MSTTEKDPCVQPTTNLPMRRLLAGLRGLRGGLRNGTRSPADTMSEELVTAGAEPIHLPTRSCVISRGSARRGLRGA
jgi:hypothetical protein